MDAACCVCVVGDTIILGRVVDVGVDVVDVVDACRLCIVARYIFVESKSFFHVRQGGHD
jgi:hypothetical protein